VELYLHSTSTSSWRGAQFKNAQVQLYHFQVSFHNGIARRRVADVEGSCKYVE